MAFSFANEPVAQTVVLMDHQRPRASGLSDVSRRDWTCNARSTNGVSMRRLLVTAVLLLLAMPGVALAGGNNGKIGFVSKQNGGDEDIWLINPDGTGATDLSQNLARDVDPAFSPDGSKIAFARFIADRNFDLFVMNADGTGERQITSTTASERFPSWSPDGKNLVYRRNVKF